MIFLLKILASIFLYGTFIVSGYIFAKRIGIKNKLERFGVGFLLITHLFTYSNFLLYAYLGVRYTVINLIFLLTPLFVVSAIFIIKLIKKYPEYIKVKRVLQKIKAIRIEKSTAFLTVLVVIPILFTCIQNIHWPVVDWDAIALYDYRAKVFYISGGMEDGIKRGYFLHYPLYTSLLHTYTYLLEMQTVRIWYSCMYIAALFIFYELLKRRVSTKKALIGTFLFAISPRIFQHSQMTYTNLPHAIYLSLAYIYLWEWIRSGKKTDVLVGALFVAGSMWVRLTEPLWLPTLVLFAIGIWKWKSQWRFTILLVLLIFILRQPWTDFVQKQDNLNITNPLQIGRGLQLSNRVPDYFSRFSEVFKFFIDGIYPMFQQYMPAITIASLYALYKEKWLDMLEYCTYFILILFVFLGIFIFSFQFRGWQDIPDSAARMTMFLLPLSVYLIVKSDLWTIPKRKK